ncbi:ABC transporter substrate-binding protein [Bartonella tamiae]|uniref:Fe/B12 periplasmic-binding domain-containing protein n=1 Tax=Bartonella tamiae Th239 TaxID=1094558 RepID=J1JVZ4_9HYPH|nr:ABC transporter substrate-binding protein [Bartonella tamiae]EJF89162.1 hypothetical protein ME5_01713 [Bartonella tamiae Th239]EJF95435.1 hypothetical protein MEG_00168 [Bartonella tamiae Th307]
MKTTIYPIHPIFIGLYLFLAFIGLAKAEPTHYPLTLKNCNRDITFNKPPERVVAVGQNTTEILYSLGLGNKVKGTALWFQQVMPEFTAINETIDVLSNDTPSLESIVSKKPDFVTNQYEVIIGPAGAATTYQQLDDLDIPVYTSPSDCLGKDNLAGGDGLRSIPFSMEMVYQEIQELSQIFDIEERGHTLITQLKERENKAREKAARFSDQKISAVAWFSSAELKMDPFVAGQLGAPGYLFKTLNIHNIVASDHDWPMVSWETIAKKNPSIIILAEMKRRRYPGDDVHIKRQFLKNDPVLSLMDAVKQDHLVVLDAQALNGSLHTMDALELLANKIEQFGLVRKNK